MKHKERVRRSFIQFGLMTIELRSQNIFSLQFPVVRSWSQTKAVSCRFFLRTHFRLIDSKITSADIFGDLERYGPVFHGLEHLIFKDHFKALVGIINLVLLP